jgi:hypothetical protein
VLLTQKLLRKQLPQQLNTPLKENNYGFRTR